MPRGAGSSQLWGHPVPSGILSTIPGLYLTCQLFLSWCDGCLQPSPSGSCTRFKYPSTPTDGARQTGARQTGMVTMPSNRDTIPAHHLSGRSSKGPAPATLPTPPFLTSSGPEPLSLNDDRVAGMLYRNELREHTPCRWP